MQNNSKWIGMALLGMAFILLAWQAQDQAARMKAFQAAQSTAAAAKIQMAETKVVSPLPAAGEAMDSSLLPLSQNSVDVKPVRHAGQETLITLENSLLQVTFTTKGGAISSVALKDYPALEGSRKPYLLKAPDELPFLTLNFTNRPEGADLNTYQVVSKTSDSVFFSRTIAKDIILERSYTLTRPGKERTAQGYLVKQVLTWKNVSTNDLQLPAFSMNVGTALTSESDPQNIFLDFGVYDGKNAAFTHTSYFKGGGFLFWNSPPRDTYEIKTPITWASVDNKFFSIICTPKTGALGATSHLFLTSGSSPKEEIAGDLEFNGPLVSAKGEVMMQSESYLGPKEYARLASLPDKQDLVMQWGWPIFSFFSKLFISMLNWLAVATHNYGAAIILLTLIIRAAMWPFTSAAAQASKKMATVQPMLKEIQEKYKNNPERLQRETLRIFQENNVNPLAGCLPALLQIPVFIGFFYMLRSAAELRFEHFLWIKDLSMPDTVATIGGFPINPLPLVMLVTMYYQMKLTPSAGDPEQQKIMQFTPFLFSFLLYNFSAGLTLYWTLSNLVSIAQQLLVNKQTLPPPGGSGQGSVIDVKATVVK